MISRRAVLAGAGSVALTHAAAPATALETCPGPGMPVGTCSALINPQRFRAEKTFDAQQESQWCWAASISMVCRFHGFHLSQKSIVTRVYSGAVNMSGDDRVLTAALNNVWQDDEGRNFRISAEVFSPMMRQSNVDNRRVIDDLKNDRPLIVGTRAHSTVLARVDYRPQPDGTPQIMRVHVVDPFPGAAPPPWHARFLEADEMVPVINGGSLRYLASIRVTPN
jgi:Papain-like cysteine protease AvrRpt2